MKLEEHIPFLSLTTFGVGGHARFVVSGEGVEDIREAILFAKDRKIPLVVLGGGSNILGDDGVSEAVYCKFVQKDITHIDEGSTAMLVVSSGALWDSVVSYATERNLFGFENLSGIPGTVGGALVQNIGAYGAALSTSASWVEVFDTKSETVRTIERAACEFGYRDSVFKREHGRYIILRAGFRLPYNGVLNTSYKDVRESFDSQIPDLSSVREAVLSIRAKKFPDLRVEGTAGSFFKNPIVSKEEACALAARFPNLPLHVVPEEQGVKIPIAWFLDTVLSLRGYSEGDVRCFETQPLVVVAKKGTSASHVRAFARNIQARVRNEIGLEIAPEVCIVRQNILTTQLAF